MRSPVYDAAAKTPVALEIPGGCPTLANSLVALRQAPAPFGRAPQQRCISHTPQGYFFSWSRHHSAHLPPLFRRRRARMTRLAHSLGVLAVNFFLLITSADAVPLVAIQSSSCPLVYAGGNYLKNSYVCPAAPNGQFALIDISSGQSLVFQGYGAGGEPVVVPRLDRVYRRGQQGDEEFSLSERKLIRLCNKANRHNECDDFDIDDLPDKGYGLLTAPTGDTFLALANAPGIRALSVGRVNPTFSSAYYVQSALPPRGVLYDKYILNFVNGTLTIADENGTIAEGAVGSPTDDVIGEISHADSVDVFIRHWSGADFVVRKYSASLKTRLIAFQSEIVMPSVNQVRVPFAVVTQYSDGFSSTTVRAIPIAVHGDRLVAYAPITDFAYDLSTSTCSYKRGSLFVLDQAGAIVRRIPDPVGQDGTGCVIQGTHFLPWHYIHNNVSRSGLGNTYGSTFSLHKNLVLTQQSPTNRNEYLVMVHDLGEPPAPPPSASLRAMEITQVVQNWGGPGHFEDVASLPLIENKPTVARLHFEVTGSDPVLVEGRMRAFRNDEGSERELPDSPNATIRVLVRNSDAAARRGDYTSSLNFALPDSWTTGDVRIQFEVIKPARIGCGLFNGDCSVLAQFGTSPRLHITFVGFDWISPAGSRRSVTSADYQDLRRRMLSLLPISPRYFRTDFMPAEKKGNRSRTFLKLPTYAQMAEKMESLITLSGSDPQTSNPEQYFLGVVKSDTAFCDDQKCQWKEFGRASDLGGTYAIAALTSEFSYAGRTHVHEFGHLVEQLHTTTLPPDQHVVCDASNVQEGNVAPADRGYVLTIDQMERATIGPERRPLFEDARVFGLDPMRGQVVQPRETFDLMSYCGGTSKTWGASRWISALTYYDVYFKLLARSAAVSESMAVTGPTAGGMAVPDQQPEYLVVRGQYDRETLALTHLDDFVRRPGPPPPVGRPSSLSVVAFDADGATIHAVNAVERWSNERVDGVKTSLAYFSATIPWDNRIHGISVVAGSSEIARRERTPHSPSIRIVAPLGGVVEGANLTIRWQASDEDGDKLISYVLFSPDAGATWIPVEAGLESRSLKIPTAYLRATNTGVIRVIVSDGMNNTFDDTDQFLIVENHPPQSVISRPSSGSVFVDSDITLAGAGYDVEDGEIVDAQLRWVSDRDGTIGTGRVLVVHSSSLSEGVHEISLVAVDSNGLEGVATTPIRVDRIDGPPQCGNGFVEPGETCDGGDAADWGCCSSSCMLLSAGVVCRPGVGSCDEAETCDGVASSCPSDDRDALAGTVCRAAVGPCDVEEVCDGILGTCPSDAVAPAGTVCREAAGSCDVSEVCDGGTACPVDRYLPARRVCRKATDSCDVSERCSGTDALCPVDARRSDRDFDGVCDQRDVCIDVWDPPQPDSDGDGHGDACDPCWSGRTLGGSVVKMTGFDTPEADDKFSIRGKFSYTGGIIHISPDIKGVRVVVYDGGRRTLFDAFLPPGLRTEAGTGWSVSLLTPTRTLYSFKGDHLHGGIIDRFDVDVIVSGGGQSLVTWDVKMTGSGRKGTFATLPIALPLAADISLEPNWLGTPLCASRQFAALPAPGCAFDVEGASLVCR